MTPSPNRRGAPARHTLTSHHAVTSHDTAASDHATPNPEPNEPRPQGAVNPTRAATVIQ